MEHVRPPADKAHPIKAIKAVLWAFLGIRKGAASERDLAAVKPWHIILAGVIGAALFVTAIVTLVRLITH
jgi:hypothetical protein